jgi:hypothetical protein
VTVRGPAPAPLAAAGGSGAAGESSFSTCSTPVGHREVIGEQLPVHNEGMAMSCKFRV